jgi:CheY-like chemotaxis protein
MPKKILLAEKSDAIRGIAESILHQNGYDVISAASIEKAKELIITARPNLMVIGADLRDKDGKYLYDSIEDSPTTTSIPLLLIADPEGRSLPFPEEVILPRPFDPKDFLDKVRLFAGGGLEKPTAEKVNAVDPFASGTIDDELLDAALGIDNISVESSEVMDKSFTTGKVKIPAEGDKTSSFGIHRPEFDERNKKEASQKVESLMIREDNGQAPAAESEAPSLSASSKIEIANDQYGLIDPGKPNEMENKHSPHDYDWFIKEMQKEGASFPASSDSGKMQITPTSDTVEQIVSDRPPLKEVAPAGTDKVGTPEIKPGGVDQFISEFKKEMEKLDSTAAAAASTDKALPAGESQREESVAPESEAAPAGELDSEEIRHFANYLAELLAEKLAKRIIDKIDVQEIYRMVKDDLAELMAARK